MAFSLENKQPLGDYRPKYSKPSAEQSIKEWASSNLPYEITSFLYRGFFKPKDGGNFFHAVFAYTTSQFHREGIGLILVDQSGKISEISEDLLENQISVSVEYSI